MNELGRNTQKNQTHVRAAETIKPGHDFSIINTISPSALIFSAKNVQGKNCDLSINALNNKVFVSEFDILNVTLG